MVAAPDLRFGLHFWELPTASWVDRVRRYERLGFSSITFTDHQVVPQWEPTAALAAVAAVTDSIRLGTLVLDMALRNPVLTAKAAATIELLSGHRLELGLGAGYVAQNFAVTGVPFERAADRIAASRRASRSCAVCGRNPRPRSMGASSRCPMPRWSWASPCPRES